MKSPASVVLFLIDFAAEALAFGGLAPIDCVTKPHIDLEILPDQAEDIAAQFTRCFGIAIVGDDLEDKRFEADLANSEFLEWRQLFQFCRADHDT